MQWSHFFPCLHLSFSDHCNKSKKVELNLRIIPGFIARNCFSLQNWTRVPWLCKEEGEKPGMRKGLGPNGALLKSCRDFLSLFVCLCISGTCNPSYWAALEGTFLRLKLDQLTATFWRVCFAESRQNLQKERKKKITPHSELMTQLRSKSNFSSNPFRSIVYLLKYSTSRSISSISVGSTSFGRNTSSKGEKKKIRIW